MKDHGYVNGDWASEGPAHIALKNKAVMFLMSLGVDDSQIFEEEMIGQYPIDVVGYRRDNSMVMVECETKIDASPPTRGQVSYNVEQYHNGHQLFTLTPVGLHEVVDRQGLVFEPVEEWQTALSPTEERYIGRWVADGAEKAEIPDVDVALRWGRDSGVGEGLSEKMIQDNNERWRANGVEPSAEQPTVYEMASETAPSRTEMEDKQ
jgi:GH43 family beta-xylosidase